MPARRSTRSRCAGTCGCPSATGSSCRRTCGCRLPAADAPDERFPVILEMIPYGKDSWRRNGDTARGEWLAARGFALCRLDVRGTGSSPGVALDEYTEAETLDGYDAVEWLAAQPWCNGNVGMWGISVRRVHRDPGREAAAAAPARDPADVRHRRPLPRRRPHPRRLRDGEREVPVRGQPAGHERDAALPAVPRRGLARASGARGSRRRRRGSWPGSASRPTGRTGGAARWRRSTRRSSAPCSRSPAGSDAYVDPGVPDPGAVHERRGPDARRQLGPLATPTTRTRARTSTGCTSSSGSSTAT